MNWTHRLHQSKTFRTALGAWGPAVRTLDPQIRRRLRTDRAQSRTAARIYRFGDAERVRRPDQATLPSNWPRSSGYSLPQPFVMVHRDVWLVGEHATPVTSTGEILLGPYRNLPWSYAAEPHPDVDDFIRRGDYGSQAEQAHDGPVFSTVGRFDRNYFHWLTETCAQLEALEALRSVSSLEPELLTRASPLPFQQQSLNLFAPSARTFAWNPADGPLRVTELIVPWQPGVPSGCSPRSLRWLQRAADSEISSTRRTRRLHIQRSVQGWRSIANHADLNAALDKFGFESIDPASLTLRQQIRLFSEANWILGQHGAGLTNMIWADRPQVIEIKGTYGAAEFVNLCACVGAMHHGVAASEQVEDSLYVHPKAAVDILTRLSTAERRQNQRGD